jgi:hypothetical protein
VFLSGVVMQPYDFGYRVGRTLEKQAERGLLTDVALYSNPFTGVPTAAYDTATNLYNGNYMGALGSAASGALSFLPGWGGTGGRMLARGLGGAGKALANAGMKQTGRALVSGARTANKAVTAGAEVAKNLNTGMAQGIQKVVPNMPGATGLRAGVNTMVKNPLATTAIGGSVIGGMTAPDQAQGPLPAAPMPSGMPAGAPAPVGAPPMAPPRAPFRPRPIANF